MSSIMIVALALVSRSEFQYVNFRLLTQLHLIKPRFTECSDSVSSVQIELSQLYFVPNSNSGFISIFKIIFLFIQSDHRSHENSHSKYWLASQFLNRDKRPLKITKSNNFMSLYFINNYGLQNRKFIIIKEANAELCSKHNVTKKHHNKLHTIVQIA